MSRCQRNIFTFRLRSSSRSMPNLASNTNSRGINAISAFNPADLLPNDDFNERIDICSRVRNLLFCLIKICFIFLISANVISLIIDPTPLLRVYDFITRPSVEETNPTCDVPKTNENSKNDDDIKHFSAKLYILKQDLWELQKKIDLIDKWRTNLEYDLSKHHRKNLEEIGQYFMTIEQRIEDALSTYDADKLGMIDYALESAGGKIVSTPNTIPYPTPTSWNFGYFQLFTPSSASQMIQAGNLPGQCFAFYGKVGRIRIRLAKKIRINSVTLEHSPFRLLSDFTSCPKNLSVLGIHKVDDETGIELGRFTFQNTSSLQNFRINSSSEHFQYVDLLIMDNYGKEEYTCVYRFRVHGIASNGNVTEQIQ